MSAASPHSSPSRLRPADASSRRPGVAGGWRAAAFAAGLALAPLAGQAEAPLSAPKPAPKPILAPLAASLPASLAAPASRPAQPEATHGRRAVPAEAHGQRYMVVAAHPMAADAARAVLAEGGTAVDAAIAAQAMLGLTEPQSSGLGGGAFALVWDAEAARLTTYDGRETAPAAATPDYWLDETGQPRPFAEAVPGGRSVGVPGVPRLLERMHQDHGRLPMARLLEPAIAAAERGFSVSPRMAASISAARALDLFPATRAYFLRSDGSPRVPGEVLRNPAYARSLRALAEAGAEPFYSGAQAKALLDAVATPSNPSPLTAQDLAGYQVIERPPVCADYRQWTVCGMGPPSSGGLTVGMILGLLERFDLAAMGDGPQAWRAVMQASALAYADRARYMADADFTPMPGGLLDRAYLASRAARIDPETAPEAPVAAGDPPWDAPLPRAPQGGAERPGTTHLSIVDAQGNAVALTSSIETGFGSRVMANGYLLNNELTDFSFRPEIDGAPVANRVEGGKRPRSSMAPTMVFLDGRPALVLGSPGGSRIIAYVAEALIRILDFGMTPAQAVAAGHAANRNGATELEAGTEAAALAPWMGRTRILDMNSGLHVIAIGEDGTLTGAADPRREGAALGD